MRLFKSQQENLFHYVTLVTYQRVPIFKSRTACQLFIDKLAETRAKKPCKLIGYVMMPDHVHLLLNPQGLNISVPVGYLKGLAASAILSWLRACNYELSLAKLALRQPLQSGQTHAVWQKDFSAIDIWSHKFARQKLHYIHLNPVRAKLCEHPAQWYWSSYRAYFPHQANEVPLEIDRQAYWYCEGVADEGD